MSRRLFVTARGAAAFAAPSGHARDAFRGGASGAPALLGKNAASVVLPVRLGGPLRRPRTLPARAHAGGDASDTAGDVPSEPRRPSVGTFASAKAAESRLQRSMAAAVAAEDFALAASIRDELHALREGDALLSATGRLRDAIAAEDYIEAARLRDLVHALTPEKMKTSSDATTDGVRVRAQSRFLAERSDPENGAYFFTYAIVVANESAAVVQLIDREWVITDEFGSVETVEGPGVIGQQPVLLPGQTFEYASACPLRTPRGKMRGSYGFVKLVTQTADEYMDLNSEGLETPDEPLLRGSKNDANETRTPLDDDGGVTFLKQPEDARFDVEVAEFGLDADAEDAERP